MAEAAKLGGLLINRDYEPEVLDFRRKSTLFWQLLKKEPARQPTIRDIEMTRRANVGPVERSDLSGTRRNTTYDLEPDLYDPGQDVKAIAGQIESKFFDRSMAKMQGINYTADFGKKTNEVIEELFRYQEMQLFRGNAAVNPLEYNGLQNQMPLNPTHVVTVNLLEETPRKIWMAINEIILRRISNRERVGKLTHIFSTGGAYLQLQEQMESSSMKFSDVSLTSPSNTIITVPGIQGIQTVDGLKPIISTPYLDDAPAQTIDINGTRVECDICRMYLIDIDCLIWFGVFPDGGEANNYDPQLFDITGYINGRPLIQSRLAVMLGTPKVRNYGIYRLDIICPRGSAWNVPPGFEEPII